MTDDVNKLGWMLDDALKMPETRHAILLKCESRCAVCSIACRNQL